MNAGWGTVIAGAMIAASLYFGSGGAAMVFISAVVAVLTAALATLGYLNLRILRQAQMFTGAMERHSDQMRQLAAKQAGVKLIWWDKTELDAKGQFPFDGEHGKEIHLDKLYIGIPWEHRRKQPGWFERWFWGM